MPRFRLPHRRHDSMRTDWKNCVCLTRWPRKLHSRRPSRRMDDTPSHTRRSRPRGPCWVMRQKPGKNPKLRWISQPALGAKTSLWWRVAQEKQLWSGARQLKSTGHCSASFPTIWITECVSLKPRSRRVMQRRGWPQLKGCADLRRRIGIIRESILLKRVPPVRYPTSGTNRTWPPVRPLKEKTAEQSFSSQVPGASKAELSPIWVS